MEEYIDSLKQNINAETIKKIENGILIKFNKNLNEWDCDFWIKSYDCKILNKKEILMPESEFEILIEVYKSSLVKWN